MTAPLIETCNVSKNFGALRAAHDVNFQFESGARHALVTEGGWTAEKEPCSF